MKNTTALDALKNIKQTLERANCMPNSPIADTIWHTPHETLFDYIDASIAALELDIAQAVEPDGWLIDGSLLYRLNEHGNNCDEINVTMVNGSRSEADRVIRAKMLMALITAPQEPAAPAWIAVSGRLPELHQSVALCNEDQYENTGGDWHRIIHAAGYLADSGGVNPYWSIRGERGSCLDAYTHWIPLPPMPVPGSAT